MRMSKLISGAMLLFGMGSICRAGTIMATFNTVNNFGQSGFNGQGTEVHIDLTPFSGSGSHYTVDGDGGEYLWTQNSGSPILGNNGAFYTFCVELTQDIGFSGTYTYTPTALTGVPSPSGYGYPTMSASQAGDIANLWANDIAMVTNNDAAIEFQTAVWDIIYDYNGSNTTPFDTHLAVTVDYSADGLSSTALNTQANSWVQAAVAAENSGKAGNTNLIALQSDSNQDQITCLAPLPSTALTGYAILGVLGAAHMIRRRGISKLA